MLIAGQRRGVSWEAMQHMTLGALVDYCTEYDNQQARAEKETKRPTKRRATQADIDAFFGPSRKAKDQNGEH